MNRKKPGAPMELKVVLTGDRRLTEDLILEVRALAHRFGLEIPNVSVTGQPSVGPKGEKSASKRKSRARVRQSTST